MSRTPKTTAPNSSTDSSSDSSSDLSGRSERFRSLPVDTQSAELLAATGLRLDLVDTSDATALANWMQAENRGFYGTVLDGDELDVQLPRIAGRRTTGVWDASAADEASPVATVSSWSAGLTIPGERSLPAWAISAVTVSPTHRRRGVARAMLEAELRSADAADCAVAMLTVSEATIYSRFGFGVATMTADWTIDTSRARWIGPIASGRVHFVTADQLLVTGHELVERVRLATPGQMEFDGILWERLLGFDGGKDTAKHLRFVRYDDQDGEPEGFAVYRVDEIADDFSSHQVDIKFFVAATDDAYAGLWRYFLELDLVNSISAPLRSVDEAIAWQVSDFRAVSPTRVRDHLWVRVLDVPVALSSRSYSAPARVVLDVTDDLGFADGLFLLTIDADGQGTVETLDGEAPDDAAAIALSVNDLGSLYLGGVSALTLTRAGRITELRPGSAVVVDSAFRSPVAPWLSIWF